MTNISPAQYDKDVNDNENLPHSRAVECILAIYILEPHQFSVISPGKFVYCYLECSKSVEWMIYLAYAAHKSYALYKK